MSAKQSTTHHFTENSLSDASWRLTSRYFYLYRLCMIIKKFSFHAAVCAILLMLISCGVSYQKANGQSQDSAQSVSLSDSTTQPEANPITLNPITVSADGRTIVTLQSVVSDPGQFFVGYGEIAVLPQTTVSATSVSVAYKGYPQILGAPFVAPATVSLLILPPGQQTFVPIASSTLVPGQSLQASGSFPVGTRFSVEASGGLNNNNFPQQCMDFCGWEYDVSLN